MKSSTGLLAFVFFIAADLFQHNSALAQSTKINIGIGGINPGTSLSFIAKKENLLQSTDSKRTSSTRPRRAPSKVL